MIGARPDPVMVMLSGIGVVFVGRSLRATGTLIRVTRPPEPGWIAWIVPMTFVLGPVIFATGVWMLLFLRADR